MKKAQLVALAAAVSLTVTACGGGTNASENVKAEGETLKVWIMKGTNASSDAFFEKVKAKFKEETGASLEVQYLEWKDAQDKMTTAFAGNTAPDVAEIGSTWTPQFADAGALEELADIDKDKYNKALVEAATVDGKMYGAPWYSGIRSVVYRKDVFDELGLKAPTTWEELREVGKAIKEKKPEMTPFAVPGSALWTIAPFIWGGGAKIATKDGDAWKSDLAGAEAKKGIQFYADLGLKEGFATAGSATWNEKDVLTNFQEGNTAMAIQGSWTPKTLTEKSPELAAKVSAFPIPGESGGMAPSFAGGSHLSVFSSAKNKPLAQKFVTMMTTGEMAKQWADESNFFPAEDAALKEAANTEDPMKKAFAEQMLNGSTTAPVSPNWGKVENKKTIQTMMEAILGGTKTVDQAAEEAAKEMDTLLNSTD